MYLQPHSRSAIRVAVVGTEDSGKTSLISRLFGNLKDKAPKSTPRANLSFWPSKAGRHAVETLEALIPPNLPATAIAEPPATNSLVDYAWVTWADVFVFVYSTDKSTSYHDSLAAITKFCENYLYRRLNLLGVDDVKVQNLCIKLPILWIGTKTDVSPRATPPATEISSAAKALGVKWIEASAKQGENTSQLVQWIQDSWEASQHREAQSYAFAVNHIAKSVTMKKNVTLDFSSERLGRLIRMDGLKRKTKRGFIKEVICFLFEKALLISKSASKGSYTVTQAIPLNQALAIDSADHQEGNYFEVHLIDKGHKPNTAKPALSNLVLPETQVLYLMAETQEDKDAWLDDITFAISNRVGDRLRSSYLAASRPVLMGARAVQREAVRQVGLPWPLVSHNALSVPVVVEAITSYLNSPTTDIWGTFLLPGDEEEERLLAARLNALPKQETSTPEPLASSTESSSIHLPSKARQLLGSTSTEKNKQTNLAKSAKARALTGTPDVDPTTPQEATPPPTMSSKASQLLLSGERSAATISKAQVTVETVKIAPAPSTPLSSKVLQLLGTEESGNNTSATTKSNKGQQQPDATPPPDAESPGPNVSSKAQKLLGANGAQRKAVTPSSPQVSSKARLVLGEVESAPAPVQSVSKAAQLLGGLTEEEENAPPPSDAPPAAAPSTTSKAHKVLVENETESATFKTAVPPKPDYSAVGEFGGVSMAGISPISAADFLLAFLHAAPTFLPHGFATLLVESLKSVDSTNHVSVLSSAYSSLPTNLFKTLARLFFMLQQSIMASGDKSSRSKLSKNLIRIFVKDSVEWDSISHSGLADAIKATIQDADSIFGLSVEAASSSHQRKKSKSKKARKIANFAALTHSLPSVVVEHLGVMNSQNVSKYITSARAIMADLLDMLKQQSSDGELEAALQPTVIKYSQLSRHNWSHIQEVVEVDRLDDFIFDLEVFWREVEAGIDKQAAKHSRSLSLTALAANLGQSIEDFTSYASSLRGYDQAKPQKREQSRMVKATSVAALLLDSNNDAGSSALTSSRMSIDPTASSDDSSTDTSAFTSSDWWTYHFGSHSLRAPTSKLINSLLAISRPSASSSGTLGKSSSGDIDAGSQPNTPRGSLLELTADDMKALERYLDDRKLGYVSLLRFSQFGKIFGPLATCVDTACKLARSPYFYGYLSEFEATKLLEPASPGAYFLRLHNNDPSNLRLHWLDESRMLCSMILDCSYGSYTTGSIQRTSGLPSNPSTPAMTPVASSASAAEPAAPSPAPSPAPVESSQQSPIASPTAKRANGGVSASPASPKTYSSLSALLLDQPELQWALSTRLYSLPYFFGDISESDAIKSLKGKPAGTFLIIFGSKQPATLDCVFVTIDDRVGHIIFHQMPADTPKDSLISIIPPSTPSRSGKSRGESTDGIIVRVESGECFASIADAVKYFDAHLTEPMTSRLEFGKTATGSINEGSLEKLVAFLYDDAADLAYITVFLLTYRSFVQPLTIVNTVIEQYRYLETIPDGKPYQLRLVNFFKIWLSDFSWDLLTAEDTLAIIKGFIQADITAKFPVFAKQLNNSITKIESGGDQVAAPALAPMSKKLSSLLGAPINDDSGHILDYTAQVLAQQLFVNEYEGFSKIQSFELLGCGWMKADKATRAPNVLRMIAKSNIVGSWLVAVLLKESVLKKRVAIIELYIAVIEESYKLNNFHSTMVVLSALHDSSIQRLKSTWEKVSKKSKEVLELMERNMSDEDNFGIYRPAFAQAPPPKMPYMGLVFRDLIHIEDGSAKFMANGSINFTRCQLFAEKLHNLKLCQQDVLTWPKDEELWQYISAFPKYADDKAQYQRSLEIEPRGGMSRSLSNSDVRRSTIEHRRSPTMEGSSTPSSPAPGNNQVGSAPSTPEQAHNPALHRSATRPPGSESRWAVSKPGSGQHRGSVGQYLGSDSPRSMASSTSTSPAPPEEK